MLVAGHQPRQTVVLLSVVGVVVLVVVLVLLAAIVRSESLAGRLGRGLEAIARRLWGLFRRPPPTGIADGVLQVRERSHETLSRRGALAFVASVLARLAWFLVLQIALWSVGVTSDVLAPSAVLTTMAVVALLALIPITPGAIGVSEVAYIGLLSAYRRRRHDRADHGGDRALPDGPMARPDPARLDPARDHARQPLARARGGSRGPGRRCRGRRGDLRRIERRVR